jgi:arginine/lysine/ornithine decarboxylase
MDLPLINTVCKYSETEFLPFRTPGHKGKWKLPFFDSAELLAGVDIADDIGDIVDAFKKSQEKAAAIFGTRKTHYLVNGSTAGVHAMFLSTTKPGDTVIVGRNLHVSAISALIMTGASPVYVPVMFDNDGIPLNVRSEDVISAIENNPDASGVFLTSSSYFSVCTELSRISATCRRYNIPLLVDEAWGGHLPFASGFPCSSLETGADLVVHGVHKTMPSLTGTALLHINSDRVEEFQVSSSLSMTETTSPNLLMYMSLEYAVHQMNSMGTELLRRAAASVEKVTNILEKNTVFELGFPEKKNPYKDSFSFDPIKLLVRTGYNETGITGYDIGNFISEKYGIYAEMADLQTILFLFTGFEDDGADDKLAQSLIDAYKTLLRTGRKPEKKISSLSILEKPAMSLIPRDAYFAPGELISLSSAKNRVLQSAIVPYPPGIPLLIPGERISAEAIDYVSELLNAGGNVRGIIHINDEIYVRVVKGVLSEVK